MDTKNQPKITTFIALIIVFFIAGVVIGYFAHTPETVEKIVYQEKIVTVTPIAATATATPEIIPAITPTATPEISDFTVKSLYEPLTDVPTYTIELVNTRANPDILSIHPGDSVLITITDTSLQSSIRLIVGTYEQNLGTRGASYITFNKKGTFNFKAIIPTGDPNIIPRTYAEGSITVN